MASENPKTNQAKKPRPVSDTLASESQADPNQLPREQRASSGSSQVGTSPTLPSSERPGGTEPEQSTANAAKRSGKHEQTRAASGSPNQSGKPSSPLPNSGTGKPARLAKPSAERSVSQRDNGGSQGRRSQPPGGASSRPSGSWTGTGQEDKARGPTSTGHGQPTKSTPPRSSNAISGGGRTAGSGKHPADPSHPNPSRRGKPEHTGRKGTAPPSATRGGSSTARRSEPADPSRRGPAIRPAAQADPSQANRPKEAAPVPVTEIIIPSHITVREFADKMHRSPIEVIKTLMNYGMMVPITESIDFDTAVVVGEELGITVRPEAVPEPEITEVVQEAPRTLRQQILADENPEELVIRPPVVTVLGHVDHGKTTLLDAIRETRVVEGEAGGITQHIGAYQVERQGRKITFLDTPGHEAFTAMRARGAMVTDIAVLVVAADDGVMPQTKEAISHARAAQVPIVIALNKIDKPNANPDRVKQELADNGLLIEEYGGDVICVPVSAKFRRGIDDLLESILLVADIDPLKANPKGNCVGTIIEGRLDKARGPLATILVQNGTLRVGDSIVSGETYGKVRAMYDEKGQPMNEALPATPAVVLGLSDVPVAGNTFSVEPDERAARAIAMERQEHKRAESAAFVPKPISLENIFAQAQAGQTKELKLILKADVQGSIEPIVNSLEKLGDEKLRVKILHEGTGNITESDVMLAVASDAIILGFSVSVEPAAQRMADTQGVDMRIYNIIYNLVEDVQKALTGLLEPVYREVVIGHAEVRAVFTISRVGKVAGCYVTDGEITRNSIVRVKRGGEVLSEDRIGSLKRFQEDVAEVKTGFECGINFANFNHFEVGDVIEAYKKERVS